MFDRLTSLEEEFDELEARLQEIYASGDQQAIEAAGRRHAELKPIVDAYREHREATSNIETSKELIEGAEPTDRDYLRAEIATAEERIAALETELKVMLIPKDPNDDKNVIVEIRGAEGGEEANLFARDLYEMYRRFAERKKWRVELLATHPSDMGGFKDVTFLIKGDQVWSHLKHEAGPHRVQRVPVTESQGRIHTSSATVSVLPEAEEVDVALDQNDLEIDVFRSSGPGGQSVNTTDSAVRVTHVPTGVVVSCQDEKSQLQNKEKALRILRARLLQMEQERQAEERSETRRSQLGSGGRADKIRTYNFKENRVTDHRVGLTLHQLDEVLAGDLDQIVETLAAAERAEQLAGVVS